MDKALLPVELRGGPNHGMLYWANDTFIMAGKYELMKDVQDAINKFEGSVEQQAKLVEDKNSLTNQVELLKGQLQQLTSIIDSQNTELYRLRKIEQGITTFLQTLGISYTNGNAS